MAAAKKKPRIVFDLVIGRDMTGDVWRLFRRGRTSNEDADKNKAALQKRAVATCNAILADGGRAQLVVHGKDGKIQTEFTYGDDPVRTKG